MNRTSLEGSKSLSGSLSLSKKCILLIPNGFDYENDHDNVAGQKVVQFHPYYKTMKQHSITLLFLFILIAGTPTSAQESDLSATSQGSIEVLDGEVEIEAVEYWDNGALAGMTLWGVGVVAVTIPPEGTEDPEASVIDYIVDIRPARSRDPEERFTAQVAGSASETVVPSRLLSLRSYWIECVGPIWYQNRNLEFVLRPKEGGEDLSIYKIPFRSFRSFLIGLSGQAPVIGDSIRAAQANGMFLVSRILYLSGFNIAYYDEDVVVGTALGMPFKEVREQIKHCGIYSVGIFGQSRGGGATRNLSWRLDYDRRIIDAPFDFTIRYTAYIDAIKVDSF